MADITLCPFCGSTQPMGLIDFQQKAEIKGKTVSFSSPAFKCSACGHEMFTPDQLDASLRAGQDAYEQRYASPSPEELVALRSRYGASQKAFSLLLGFGELTMNSYEQGGTPNSTHRLLLELSGNPVCFVEMYRINSEKIGLLQRKRIEESEGYKAGKSWSVMGSLSAGLTGLEKEKVEFCADTSGVPLSSKITEYVRQGSFKDYSSLVQSAKWSETETSIGAFELSDNCLGNAS